MLTIEQSRKLKELLGTRDIFEEHSRQYREANVALTDYIDSITAFYIKERISPVVGVIRSMEMTHEEAVQRVIKALE